MDLRAFIKNNREWLAAISTGILLSIAYPPAEVSELAWLALVPLLLILKNSKMSFRLGFTTGAVFWIANLYWISRVTIAGWLVLALYCSIYFGLFAAAYPLLRRTLPSNWWGNLSLMLTGALLWSGLEWLRGRLFTGFSWNQLAVSQYANTVIIQSADWGGIYAVSALIMVMNLAIALTIERYVDKRGEWGRRPHTELIAAVMLVAVFFAYGIDRVSIEPAEDGRSARLALVQPNVEQTEKWDEAHISMIYERLERLSLSALPFADVIVWPETAVPEFLRDSPRCLDLIARLHNGHSQLLIGSMDYEVADVGDYIYYNSAFLIDERGHLAGRYDKQHLVLFGEYVPFERYLTFLGALTPIEASFTPGDEPTILELGPEKIPSAVLICFEDTFAHLARNAVKKGARLLVNQTNNAWFDPTSGSRQHLAQNVFRTVENRVPMVRCANTGISGLIDAQGRVKDILTDADGSVMTEGFLTVRPVAAPDDMELTVQTTSNGLFGRVCASLAGLILIRLGFDRCKRRQARVKKQTANSANLNSKNGTDC